jgi:succinylglutamate desuccinylase
MELGQRFKDENLNRLFCGNFKQTDGLEARRAERLEQHTRQFFDNSPGKRFHYDLHTAIRGSRFEKFAIYPFQHEKPWQKSQLEFLAACGVNTILLNHTPASTFSYYSSRTFDAHSFTIELGKVRPFGENDMTRFSAISDCMCQLIQGEDVKVMPFENKNFNIFKVVAELIKRTDEFKLCITEDVRNFTRFPSGHLVAEDGEERYITQQEGECIIFPNANVGIGQRAALMVVPVTLL